MEGSFVADSYLDASLGYLDHVDAGGQAPRGGDDEQPLMDPYSCFSGYLLRACNSISNLGARLERREIQNNRDISRHRHRLDTIWTII
ncbi:hypothetical protein SLS55_002094 [Diplodia seriata]|uniref:Uncharacterized protein n=1 Tax=Diplodia seriata TaxID=420778 RepID=A0ABR3CR89_9PEZI